MEEREDRGLGHERAGSPRAPSPRRAFRSTSRGRRRSSSDGQQAAGGGTAGGRRNGGSRLPASCLPLPASSVGAPRRRSRSVCSAARSQEKSRGAALAEVGELRAPRRIGREVHDAAGDRVDVHRVDEVGVAAGDLPAAPRSRRSAPARRRPWPRRRAGRSPRRAWDRETRRRRRRGPAGPPRGRCPAAGRASRARGPRSGPRRGCGSWASGPARTRAWGSARSRRASANARSTLRTFLCGFSPPRKSRYGRGRPYLRRHALRARRAARRRGTATATPL